MSLAASDSSFLCSLVRERSAIVLDETKSYLIESRLTPIVRRENMGQLDVLVKRLRALPYGPLHETVVEAMTTNETSFFRDVHPFNAFRTTILPRLREENRDARKLRIWSAACSSGQEPSSLAMLLDQHAPDLLQGWDVSIVGTDLSNRILERAREGLYTKLEVNRGLPAPLLARYFEADGAMWRLKPAIRARVEYRTLNLIGLWSRLPFDLDVVFLRNVLIYFDDDVKRTILTKLKRVMRPGGYLFLGASETTRTLSTDFELESDGRANWYRLG